MIVGERPSAVRLLLTLRGSVVPDIWLPLLFCVALASLITLLEGRIFGYKLDLDVAPFTLIGMTLAIFLGFRNSACYERYWEGRSLWGRLVLASRNLARQTLTWVQPPAGEAEAVRRRIIRRVIAAAHALRHELRDSDSTADLAPLLDAGELERVCAARGRTNALLLELARDLQTCRERGWLDTYLLPALDRELDQMSQALAGCERIKNTPLPFAYTLLMHRTIFIYCVLLPFGLIDVIGVATPLIAAILAYTFFGLDALGTQIEEPFGTLPNDLPLAALCRTVEIDLRQMLGDADVPPPLQPVDWNLT